MSQTDTPIIETDVLVIGTEGAGARAAIEASKSGLRVLAITKGLVARSGATLTADGEIDIDSRSAKALFHVNGSDEDSPEQFATDMIVEGDYLADQNLAAIHAQEAPDRIKELFDWGAKLEGFIQAPGHSYPRGVWIPGVKLARLLAKRMTQAGVSCMENTMALELILVGGEIAGVLAFHIPDGQFVVIRASAIILATGGAMRLFNRTTAPEELTGDGLAMALKAGAKLREMEFPMFLPYTFIDPEILNGVIFSYDVSALVEVHALNRHGERYMRRWDPQRMERTTRDINSVGAEYEVINGRGSEHGGTYLSFAHLPKRLVNFSTTWFPDNLKGWKAAGFDLKKYLPSLAEDAWEVAPACHFWNGGVQIDSDCRTGIPGLFAAGEGTAGIHGANRLAGNALTMTQVWGTRAGSAAAQYARQHSPADLGKTRLTAVLERFERIRSNTTGTPVFEVRRKIRDISSHIVGIVREQKRLDEAMAEIQSLRQALPGQRIVERSPVYNREWVECFQNENLLDVLEMVVRASTMRQESRGAMYRLDHPQTNDDDWLVNILITRQGDEWQLVKQPVKEGFVPLPKGKRAYGVKGMA